MKAQTLRPQSRLLDIVAVMTLGVAAMLAAAAIASFTLY